MSHNGDRDCTERNELFIPTRHFTTIQNARTEDGQRIKVQFSKILFNETLTVGIGEAAADIRIRGTTERVIRHICRFCQFCCSNIVSMINMHKLFLHLKKYPSITAPPASLRVDPRHEKTHILPLKQSFSFSRLSKSTIYIFCDSKHILSFLIGRSLSLVLCLLLERHNLF